MSRAITVVLISVVKTIASAEIESAQGNAHRNDQQNQFECDHGIPSG